MAKKIITPKKDEYVKFKNCSRKIKSPYMIYGYFESVLVPGHSGKQNTDVSCINKHRKYIACSYGCKLVYADTKFSKPLKISLILLSLLQFY